MSKILLNSVKEGNLDEVRRLMNEGVDVNGQDNIGRTALLWASYYRHKDKVQLMFKIKRVRRLYIGLVSSDEQI